MPPSPTVRTPARSLGRTAATKLPTTRHGATPRSGSVQAALRADGRLARTRSHFVECAATTGRIVSWRRHELSLGTLAGKRAGRLPEVEHTIRDLHQRSGHRGSRQR